MPKLAIDGQMMGQKKSTAYIHRGLLLAVLIKVPQGSAKPLRASHLQEQ